MVNIDHFPQSFPFEFYLFALSSLQLVGIHFHVELVMKDFPENVEEVRNVAEDQPWNFRTVFHGDR